MQCRAFLSPERSREAWLLAALVAATSSTHGAEPQATSREEIVDRWDLDGNGTIDEAEAALARKKMRRARLELEAQSGIDPLTGRPRGAAEEPATPADEAPVEPPPPPPRRRSSDEPPLPGTRVPDVKRPDAPQDPTRPASRPAVGSARRELAPPKEGTGNASSAPPRGPLTGGIRAGAPAARPGYSARAPFSTLNPGRGRVTPGSIPAAARPDTGRMSGGLVPRPLLPTTPGGAARGGSNAGRPLVNPPPAPPVPTLPKPPRVTAEDIGGG